MRWGYLLGPLTLLPLLGALFLIPQPEDEDGRLRFDRASLSLLECHIQAAAFFAFDDDRAGVASSVESAGQGARVER